MEASAPVALEVIDVALWHARATEEVMQQVCRDRECAALASLRFLIKVTQQKLWQQNGSLFSFPLFLRLHLPVPLSPSHPCTPPTQFITSSVALRVGKK